MRIRTSVGLVLLGLAACTPQLATPFSCDAGEVLVAGADGGYVCAANYLDAGAPVDLGEVHGELAALDGSVQNLAAGQTALGSALQGTQGQLDASVQLLQAQINGLDASVQLLDQELAALPPASASATPNTLALRSATGSLTVNGLGSSGLVAITGDLLLFDGGIFFGIGQPVLQASFGNENINVGVGTPTLTPVQNDGGFAGGQNTALGFGALKSNKSGSGNVAVGAGALNTLASGAGNTAIGASALGDCTSCTGSIAIGSFALLQNVGGANNTSVGFGSQQAALGSNNTSVGYDAMSTPNGASFSTALGGYAGQSMGSFSTAIGYGALEPATGDSNIAIGYTAGQTLGSGRADIDIGNAGVSGESHVLRIGTQSDGGTDSGINSAYIAGINAVQVSGAAVVVSSSGQLGTTTSSARYKHEIRDLGHDSDVLLALRPVSFKYKPEYDKAQRQQYGLIAEEVVEVAPQLVLYDAEGKLQTVRYDQVNAMLLNEVQKQRRELDALTARLKALETRR